MQFKKFGFIALLSFSLLSQNVFAMNDTVTYKNTRGSILKLHLNTDNTLSGTFTTAVASKECQQAIGMVRPIIGYIVKNALTFSVSYPPCGSVVTFIGNIEGNNKIIDATAILAHQSVQIATEGPGARMISHEMFQQI